MQTIEEIYEDLTGVDIDTQRDIWDERGKGYFGEYLMFHTLFDHLSDDSKILMNVELPDNNPSKKTEIDLLLIHETGIYCFEIKHYKGDIYCNFDRDNWVQAFRTTRNHAFYNPVKQNEGHIEALKNFFPYIRIHPIVVFTNDYVTLHDGRESTFSCIMIDDCIICNLEWLSNNLDSLLSDQGYSMKTEEINSAFIKLEPYSKIKKGIKICDSEIMSFSDYINSFRSSFNRRVERFEIKAKESIGRSRIVMTVSILVAILSIIAGCYGTMVMPQKRIEQVENEYSEFFQKFERINENTMFDNLKISDIVYAEDVEFNRIEGVDGMNVTFKVSGKLDNYGIALNGTSRLIIQMNDGSVKEVDIFSDKVEVGMILRNNAWLTRAYKGCDFIVKTVDIPSIDQSDVSYMKLNNISLYKSNYNGTPLTKTAEMEVFKK